MTEYPGVPRRILQFSEGMLKYVLVGVFVTTILSLPALVISLAFLPEATPFIIIAFLVSAVQITARFLEVRRSNEDTPEVPKPDQDADWRDHAMYVSIMYMITALPYSVVLLVAGTVGMYLVTASTGMTVLAPAIAAAIPMLDRFAGKKLQVSISRITSLIVGKALIFAAQIYGASREELEGLERNTRRDELML